MKQLKKIVKAETVLRPAHDAVQLLSANISSEEKNLTKLK